MKILDIINKAKLAIIKTKAYILVAVIVLSLITACILIFGPNQDKVIEQKTAAKKESTQKAEELKNNVVNHDKVVQEKVKDIQDIIEKRKPFKPLKHEEIKVKNASYDAMRRVLDTAQPNK